MVCENCEYNKENIVKNIYKEIKYIKLSDNDSINKYFT